ncbi:MAG TPA: ATP synthase subunit I [Terriglobales bacterium]|nr:ATP synthase subunit I [Terriglobales bacterium]
MTNDSPVNDVASSDLTPSDMRLQSFNDRALPRMFKTMLVVSVLLLGPAFWKYHLSGAIGFAAGAAISCINFRALQRSVEGLADRIVNQQSSERGGRIVLRFLLRYALVGAVACAIFRGSAMAFRGFLWGLCLPVAVMMIEAGVEAWAAFRK